MSVRTSQVQTPRGVVVNPRREGKNPPVSLVGGNCRRIESAVLALGLTDIVKVVSLNINVLTVRHQVMAC